MLASDRNYRQILAAIVICGFALRAWGIWFGLPLRSNLYIRPDESLIVASAVQFWQTGGHPGFFAYPALMMEICALLYLPWQWFGEGIVSAFSRDPSPFFLIARVVSVIAGTLSIIFVSVISRRLVSPAGALIAAALFAFAPLAVRDAHFGVTDTLLVFLLLAAMAWPVRADSIKDAFIVGALFGLACSTKYPAILLAPALALRIAIEGWKSLRGIIRNLSIAGVASVLTFAILNPYLFVSEGKSSGEIANILGVLYRVQTGDTAWNPFNAIMQVLRPLRHGPAGYVGVALAVLSPFALRRAAWMPVAIAAAVFAAALLPFQHIAPYRYALPIVPFVAILAAGSIDRLPRTPWKALLTIALIVPGMWDTIRLNSLLTRTDTRSQAAAWIESNVPADVPILLLGLPECEPQLVETRASIQRRIEYVHSLYGQASGDIVSIPYKMMLRSAPVASPGREVYRGSLPPALSHSQLLVVTPSSPLPLVRNAEPFASLPTGDVLKSITLSATKDASLWEYDAVDAFFLPFEPLEAVNSPGPSLKLVMIRKLR